MKKEPKFSATFDILILKHIIQMVPNHATHHKCHSYPVDTGRKLNVYMTFKRRPGRLLNVLCTFNLRHVSTG